ncbi:hypothetical protein KC351_g1983 [Hortaea werneckii]|nr:hypothetical protein KC351_g1983 [Hortaea werneckii]
MLVDDHPLYHPSWDRPDPRAAELHKPPPVCLRPTVNKRHHSVCALLRLLWRTESQAVSRRDASLGFCPGDSWADYGSVRLRGSGETKLNRLGLLALLQPQLDQSALELQRLQSQVRGCEAKIQRLKSPFAKERTSFHDGQAILAVKYDGNTAYFDPNKACDAARVTAEKAGELRAFTEIPSRYPSLEIPRRILCDQRREEIDQVRY